MRAAQLSKYLLAHLQTLPPARQTQVKAGLDLAVQQPQAAPPWGLQLYCRFVEACPELWPQEYADCARDFGMFAARWLWIENKQRNLQRFTFNEGQRKFLAGIGFSPEGNGFPPYPVEAAILKSRKYGFSTLICGLFFWLFTFRSYQRPVELAHVDVSAVEIFKIIKCFERHLPEFLHPVPQASNRREIIWERRPGWIEAADWPDLANRAGLAGQPLELNCSYLVRSAESYQGGRGGDITHFHQSERAFYRDPASIDAGMGQSLVPGAWNIPESTANRLNHWYDEWQGTPEVDAEGRNRKFFFGVWGDPTNRRPCPAGIDWTAEEEELRVTYSLDDDQLWWRRKKKEEDFRTDPAQFAQEYPATPEEAFVSSGAARFDRALLTSFYLPRCGPPELWRDGEALAIWQLPEPGQMYTIGVDTAEGVPGGDYCAAVVLNDRTGAVVAVLHGRWSDHAYAGKLKSLARFYNGGCLAVERENHGHSVLSSLLNNPETEYGNLYYHKDYDAGPGRKRPGWTTNAKTKPIALGELEKALGEKIFTLPDQRIIAELLRYGYLPGGKTGAESGHDDLVMALAIAWTVRQEMYGGLRWE